MSTSEFFRILQDSYWVKVARTGMLYLYLPTFLNILSSSLSLIVTELSIHNCINSGWLSEPSWSKPQIYRFIYVQMSFYNFVSVPLGTFTFFFVKKPKTQWTMDLLLCMRKEKTYNFQYFLNIGAEQKFGLVKTKYVSNRCIHPFCVCAAPSTSGFWSFVGDLELKC